MSNEAQTPKGSDNKQASLPATEPKLIKCRVTHGSLRTIVGKDEVTLQIGDECTLTPAEVDLFVAAGVVEKIA